MNKDSSVTPERLMQFAWGFSIPLIIETAVDLKIFDHLDSAPLSVDELSIKTKASRRGLRAILDALLGVELLQRSGDKYALTPESSSFLVSTKPAYHGAFFRHISAQLIPAWLPLTEVVRAGCPPKLKENNAAPKYFADFVESLFPLSYAAAQKLGEHLEMAKSTEPLSVLDIGAGSGVWGIALAQQSPHVGVRAVDWPQVLEITEKVARRCGVHDRLTVSPGDLLEADFGQGHQVATIGHILHGIGVKRSQQLLRKTFAALAPGGTVAIMEFLANDQRTGPPAALIFAVNMLVNTEAGDTFTFAEISDWLQHAGFINPRLLDVPAVSPLVLATRP